MEDEKWLLAIEYLETAPLEDKKWLLAIEYGAWIGTRTQWARVDCWLLLNKLDTSKSIHMIYYTISLRHTNFYGGRYKKNTRNASFRLFFLV